MRAATRTDCGSTPQLGAAAVGNKKLLSCKFRPARKESVSIGEGTTRTRVQRHSGEQVPPRPRGAGGSAGVAKD